MGVPFLRNAQLNFKEPINIGKMFLPKKNLVLCALIAVVIIGTLSFRNNNDSGIYISNYYRKLNSFKTKQSQLLHSIEGSNLQSVQDVEKIKEALQLSRNELKGLDFWFRYLEPIAYKKINGPLPVEWETEVFEKFEAPYKREGAGLTLAALYL